MSAKAVVIPPTTQELAQLTQRAIADGRHSRVSEHLCTGCYQWVDAIWHTTDGGQRLCARCADGIGQGPKAIEERRRKFEEQRRMWA